MNDNIYSAPESELEYEAEITSNEFYVVSKTKFTILFFATMGLYGVYWFYKNWAFYKNTHSENIWPVARGFFSIFFAHSLFRKVDERLKEKASDFKWDPSLMATLYVIFAIAGNVLDRMSMRQTEAPYLDILSILILVVIYAPLAKAQKAINISQQDDDGQLNSNFTIANYLWVLFGLMLWALVVVGLLASFGY